MSRKNRNSRSNKPAVSERVKTAWCLCAAMGQIPPAPRAGMSEPDYYELLKRIVYSKAKANMGRLGQIWLDPEWPDTWESFIGLLLLSDMKSVSEYTAAMSKLETTAAAALTGGSDAAAQAAVLGMSTEEVEDAQTWTQNTSDWWSQTWSGDWGSGLESFTEGWNALWSGRF